jgi:uncharacterized paraquat-inducible protein A
MPPAPCPDCGHALIRSRRRWYERAHVRIVKRCTRCGLRLTYAFGPSARSSRERLVNLLLLAVVFLVLAVVGPVVIISLLPSPDEAIGPRVSEE